MPAISRLRAQCLTFWEVLAQTIALISPTMTAVLIVPLMYGRAGNASWLAYALGTLTLAFVAVNINVFARRSSHTGSLFLYSVAGLGATSGALAGWCLVWAYVFIGAAGIAGFTMFSQQLLRAAGIHASAFVLFSICGLASWYLAYRDVALSTIVMLAIESVSIALIVALALLTLGHFGFTVDRSQLSLKGSSLSKVGLGVVVAIFSLLGFESATAFGEETKSPLKTIPRAVIASLLISGGFFVFISYVEILGLHAAKPPLVALTTPLSALAAAARADILAFPLTIAALLSLFALALSAMNAGARVMYQMGRKGFLPAMFGRAHPYNLTPHVAITTMAIVEFGIPAAMKACGLGPAAAFSAAATSGAFGFLAAYVFISLAAPMYLRKIGALRGRDVALSAFALSFLLIPTVGSAYRASAPFNACAYAFIGYFIVGWIVFFARRDKTKDFASRSLAEDAALMAVDGPAIA